MSGRGHSEVQPDDGYNPINQRDPQRSRSVSKSGSMEDEPTETSPLLSRDGSENGDIVDLPQPHLLKSPQVIIWTVIAVVVWLSLGDQLMESPTMRIMESVVCYRYYEEIDPGKILLGRDVVGPGAIGGVAEKLCKEDAVQAQLAMLRGYQQFFDGVPSLLLAVPFGWAADRFGRKPVIMLGLLSFIVRAAWIQLVTWFWQSFDIRMTWLSTLHGLMGGSSPVVISLLLVVLSDITPNEELAAVFLRVGSANILAALLMPPLAAWWMSYNPWIPNICGILIMVVAALLYIMVPETMGYRDLASNLAAHPSTPPLEPIPDMPITDAQHSRLMSKVHRWQVELKNATAFLTHDWRVPILIVLFLGHQLIGSAGALLLQYCSKRYHLTVSNATLLMTIFNGVRTLLFLIILPFVSTAVMTYFHLCTEQKDLYLSRISLILMALGWTIMALAPNIPAVAIGMVVAAVGQGAFFLLRSFLTSLVPAHHVARVYSIVSIFDTLGMMLGGPLMSELFKGGLSLGGGWVGLPFYFIGLLSLAFAIVLGLVRLRKGEGEHVTIDEEE